MRLSIPDRLLYDRGLAPQDELCRTYALGLQRLADCEDAPNSVRVAAADLRGFLDRMQVWDHELIDAYERAIVRAWPRAAAVMWPHHEQTMARMRLISHGCRSIGGAL